MKLYILKTREKIFSLKLKFITWLHDRNPEKRCWADCVSWAYRRDLKFWKIKKPCKDEKPCYCGQWYGGRCLNSMSEEEIEKIRNL